MRKRKRKTHGSIVRDIVAVQKALRSICKKANATSLFHLSIAVFQGHKYFTTLDKSIIRNTKQIKRRYKIKICQSLYDVDNPEDLKKIAFERGIYI